MNRIFYRRGAQRDIDSIWTYIAEHDADAADRLIADFQSAVCRLVDHPKSAPARPELGSGLRAVSVRGHLIVYRIEVRKIDIVRVIDGRRDVPAVFRLEL